MTPRDDRRYHTARWRRAREAVLRRDRVCQVVPGCRMPATVADHVQPVHLGMPDVLFFGLHNLRASCRDHNLGRAFMKDAPDDGPSSVVTGDYS